MRARTDQPRDGDRAGPESREDSAPVAVGTASGDPARQVLAALRAAEARRRPGAPLAAALEALAARAHDPSHAEPADETDLDERAPGPAPERAPADRSLPERSRPAPTPGTDLPDDDARIDARRPSEETAARLASVHGRIADLRIALAGRRDLRPPETWILAAAIADLLGGAVEHDGGGGPAEDAGLAALPAIDRDALPHQKESPFDIGLARHRAADGRAAESPEARQARRQTDQSRQRNTEVDKALAKGPVQGKSKQPPRSGDKPPSGATGQSQKPAPAPGPADTVKVVPATGGEADGGATVAAWKGRLDARSAAVTAEPIPDGDRYVAIFQAASSHAEAQTDQRKRELLAQAKVAVTPVKEYNQGKEDDFKLPNDPLPDARAKVDGWIDRRIRKQDLPALRKSPLGSLPEIGTSTYSDKEGKKHVVRELSPGRYGEIHVLAPGEKPPMLGRYDEVRKETKLEGQGTLADRLKAHNDTQPRNLKPPAPKSIGGNAYDDLPLQAPTVPSLQGMAKIDTGKVLEAALAGVDDHTRKILTRTVDAFPGGGGLPTGYVDDWRADVKSDVVAELEKIRVAGHAGNKSLQAKLAAERDKVDQDVKAAHEKVKDAKLESKAGYRTQYEAIGDEIRGLRDDLDRQAEEEAAVAKGGFEAKRIKEQKETFLKANTDKVETWLGRYEGMRTRRREQLDKSEAEQTAAYQACAELDRRQINTQAGSDKDQDPAKTQIADALKAIDDWELDVIQGINAQGVEGVAKTFERLRSEADTDVDRYTENLKTEGEAYERAVEEWARDRLGMERSFWARLLDFILDWFDLAQKETKVWQVRSEDNNSAHLAGEEIFLKEFQLTHHGELTELDLKEMQGLAEDQRAILHSFFVNKSTKGDGAAALAAGLMVRLGMGWRPRLHQRLEQKILKDHSSVIIDVANRSGISVEGKVAELREGFSGPGTKKEKIFTALQGLSTIQARAVEFKYELTFGTPLRAEIEDELHDLGDILFYGSHDADRARALLAGSRSHADLKDPTKLAQGEAAAIAIQIDQTMKGTFLYGAKTDVKELLKLLRGRSLREMEAIKREYFARYGRSLAETIGSQPLDLASTPWQWEEAHALLEGRTKDAEVAAMRGAMGHVRTEGPRSYTISAGLSVLMPGVGMTALAVGGDDDTILNRMTRDPKLAEESFQRIQAETAKDAAQYAWNDVTYRRQLGLRLKVLDDAFGTKYGGEFGVLDPKQSALTIAFGKAFSADQAKLLTGIRTQDLALESAARVSIEHKAFLPDRKEVDKALADQFQRQYAADRRDVESEQRAQKSAEWTACTVYQKDGKTVDRDQTRNKQRAWRTRWVDPLAVYDRKKEADAEAERRARAKAPANMAALKRTYEDPDLGFVSGSVFSQGSFEGDVYSATNVSWAGVKDLFGVEARSVETDKTMALLAGSGYLTGGQQLFYAVYGSGTDEEAVHRAYAGKTPAEIAEMHKDLRRRMTAAGVSESWTPEAWVKDDFSGRELDDVTVEMEFGEAVTPEQKVKRAERRRELEKESRKSGIGSSIVGTILLGPVAGPLAAEGLGSLREAMARTEMDLLDAQVEALKHEVEQLDKDKADLAARGVVEGDVEYYEVINARFEQIGLLADSVDSALAAHRAQIDAIADWAAIVIQVVVGIAALIAGIILTPVTGGLSVAIAIAVISTLVAAGLTMAAKAVIKGGAYGWEEAVTDATLAVVEAIAAGLTAGFGGPLLKGLGLAKTELDGMIVALVRKSVGHFITGSIQAAPGAFLGALLNDGDFMSALEQILQGGLMAVALGTATDPITEHFHTQKVRMADRALNARTSPAEFDKAYKAAQQENPGTSRARLRAQLDEMILAGRPEAFKEPAVQNAMRAELLEGLPPAQRKAMEHARIDVVRERDFARLTGNTATEPAAIVMKEGVPVLVVKAGTDLALLGRRAPDLFRSATEAMTPPPAKAAVDRATPRPRGASASPDPNAPDPQNPRVPGEPPPHRVILEPYAGPRLDSPIDIAARNPGAHVIATEATIRPDAAEIGRLNDAGGTFIPDNKPGHLPVGSVDDIKMRFPIPHERAIQQDFLRRLSDLEALHPTMPRRELLERAMHDTVHQAESLTAYGPYALERLKPGGTLEVAFWERQILSELGDVGRLRFIDPATGRGYRLELVHLEVTTRGAVAPHSGFGITGITNETQVHVARFQKVELETNLPHGARGPDVVGAVVGEHSGRPFFPDRAGGPIRDLDYSKIRFSDRGVDVVEAHIRRFGGGGEMELAMVDRLRQIAAKKIPATDFDRAFYSHELRESVRYRTLGLREGQPLDADEAYRVWNDAHTATLEDYKLRERLPSGARALFHPEVVERFEPGPTGGRGPEAAEVARPAELLAPGEALEPGIRRSLERELSTLGQPAEDLRGISDRELLRRYARAQIEQAPRRIAEFRSTLDERAQSALDSLQAATDLHHGAIAGALEARVSLALDTPVHVDPTIPPGEVRVRYKVGVLGNVHGIELHVGTKATLGDVLGHIPTLAAYKRYQGLTGVVRQVTAAMDRLLKGGARLPVGSRAHEAWHGVEKLPGIIEGRRLRLADQALDVTTRARLEREIRALEGELAHYVSELGDLSAGVGYVAARPDLSTPEGRMAFQRDVEGAAARLERPPEFIEAAFANAERGRLGRVELVELLNAFPSTEDVAILRSLLETAGGSTASAPATVDFLERVSRIRQVEGVTFELSELHQAFLDGDAILTHGPLQEGIFLNDVMGGSCSLNDGRLGVGTSKGRLPAGLTLPGATAPRLDWVIIEHDGTYRMLLGWEHSGLTSGRASVFAAGMMEFDKNGFVVEVTNQSGHYRPSAENLERAVKLMYERGILSPQREVLVIPVEGS